MKIDGQVLNAAQRIAKREKKFYEALRIIALALHGREKKEYNEFELIVVGQLISLNMGRWQSVSSQYIFFETCEAQSQAEPAG